MHPKAAAGLIRGRQNIRIFGGMHLHTSQNHLASVTGVARALMQWASRASCQTHLTSVSCPSKSVPGAQPPTSLTRPTHSAMYTFPSQTVSDSLQWKESPSEATSGVSTSPMPPNRTRSLARVIR